MAGDVAGTSRVTIVPPCAADVVRFLIDSEILVAQQTLELNSHSEAGDASTDDYHFFLCGHVQIWCARSELSNASSVIKKLAATIHNYIHSLKSVASSRHLYRSLQGHI